jgi:tetratricopeptide (TPR) repeat protein
MEDQRVSVARLSDDNELSLSFAPELGWRPLRHLLGLRAFGMNAYTCHVEGGQLIEEHDELGDVAGGHEEVYVVMTGHAVFTVDGEEIDAPAGTFVAVHDPAVPRGARALGAGTTALAVGGAPGRSFEVSTWEYTFRAEAASRSGRPEEGITIMGEALRRHPDHPALLYNLACYESLTGQAAVALEHLRRAVAIDPKYAGYAADDADLDAVRDLTGFPGSAA